MKHSLYLVFILLAMVACKPSVPSAYIQPDDMEDLLYDYYLARAMSNDDHGGIDYVKRASYFQAVLQKHQVTEAEFDSSLVYYHAHIDRMKSVFSRVNERLAAEGERVGAAVGDINRYSQYSTSGDTANIWMGDSDVLLIPRATKNRWDFTVKADSTFRQGDSFMFQFVSESIWESGNPSAVVAICAVYDNDSIEQYTCQVVTSNTTQLTLRANNTSRLQELRGFIYLGNEDYADIRRLLFISQIQLIRFHQVKSAEDETNSESIPADSIPRADDSGGATVDTAGRPAGTGLRSKTPPFRRRVASH